MIEKRKCGKVSVMNLILWIDVIIVLINSGTAFQLLSGFVQYLMVIPLLFHATKIATVRKNQKFIPYVMCSLVIITTAIINLDNTINFYILLLIDITAILGIIITYSICEILDVFLKILTILTAISIVGYYLVNYTSFGSGFPSLTNSNGIVYKFSYLYVFRPDLVFRNHCIFWEPGLFATMLIIAMLYIVIKLKYNKTVGNKSVVISVVQLVLFSWALYTTNSSAGIILFMMFLLFAVLIQGEKRRSLVSTVCSIVLVGIIIVGIFNYESIIQFFGLSDNYFFTRITTVEGFEKNARYLYFLKDLELIGKNPIFGYGIVNSNDFVAQGGGDTCTSIHLILVFGIAGIGYTLLFLYSIIKQKYGLCATIVLCVIVIFILNKEPHLQIMFTWILLFGLLWKSDGRMGYSLNTESINELKKK